MKKAMPTTSPNNATTHVNATHVMSFSFSMDTYYTLVFFFYPTTVAMSTIKPAIAVV